ncbi:uncharacterized protein PFL1_03229 [Pseudozyma flocculosa PF-1]|uniref:Transcription activator of gluconeogenesis ERT1 n=2 Tax=Pseudozyma flocculosa TaxID=84751 RepID=A0A5C3F0F8_9BASI|nr:uncharacterized protein PFL1_03229 [Pseudozyma flocculosa PF-1]EPQ29474.1 hypothetical protein PFL1_03229 [Pseudozyma flocculosa PF-1]SPO38004.1 uncharacterized protein PSFLO_03481 [Pseudozyma flocculosa]
MSDRSNDGRTQHAPNGEQSRRTPLPPLGSDRLPPLAGPGPLSTSSSSSSSSSSANNKPVLSLPPPPPFRMHSYHHPLPASSSYSTSFDSFDRDRGQPPTQQQPVTPQPAQSGSPHRWSRSTADPARPDNGQGELPRFLVQRSGSSSNNSFQLPPLSASLGSLPGWRSVSNGDAMRRSPVSPGGHGPHIDAFRENAAMMLGARVDDRMLPPYSPPLGVPTASPLDSAMAASSSASSIGRDAMAAAGATRKMAKAHVPSACLNCKRAHLACDVGRPCRRCINLGKSDTCIDVQHKKRGRPRLKDRQESQTSVTRPSTMVDGAAGVGSDRASTSPSSSMGLMRYSPASEPSYFQSPPRQAGILSPPILSSSMSSSSSSSMMTSTAVHRVSGPTHGAHPQTRTPSASVSASSYPYSRPDHARTFSDGHAASAQPASAVVTIICSTNLQCARVSEDCQVLLGYQPSEVLERSLFELVHPTESTRLEELWTSLIDPVGVLPQAVPASAEVVMSTPPARLMAPAAGTIFVQENMRLRQRNGMYDFYSIRLHLGGGFGVDLYRRETLDRAYIVASLLKLGNDATHPDTAVLRNPYGGASAAFGGPESAFWTPTSRESASSRPGAAKGFDGQQAPNGGGLPAYAPKADPQYRRQQQQQQQQQQQRSPTLHGFQCEPARPSGASAGFAIASETSTTAREAAIARGPPSPIRAEAPASLPRAQKTRQSPPAASRTAAEEHDGPARRDEAVPSYSKLASRTNARPAAAVAGATSPAGKRRSSISMSATSPHASFRSTVLASSRRTSSSRDGITC